MSYDWNGGGGSLLDQLRQRNWSSQGGSLFQNFGSGNHGSLFGGFGSANSLDNSLFSGFIARRKADAEAEKAAVKQAARASTTGNPGQAPANTTQLTPGTATNVNVAGTQPWRSKIDQHAQQIAAQYGLDPTELADWGQSFMAAESGGDQTAVGAQTPYGQARGLMQVMPMHAPAGMTPEQMHDPDWNIRTGLGLLAQHRSQTGDWRQVAARYYGTDDADYWNRLQTAYGQIRPQTSAPQGQVPASQVPVNRSARPMDGDLVPNQFDQSQLPGAGDSGCGPAAVTAVLRSRGLNVNGADVMAKTSGLWDAHNGIYGPDATVQLLSRFGVPAQLSYTVDPNAIGQQVAAGRPVIISSPLHYYVLQSAGPNGTYYVGNSGTVRIGGAPYLSLDDITRLDGSINGVITTG